MKNLKVAVSIAAILVLLICVYSFLLGNDVFKGKFANESIPWYFLAKGLFCSIALYLLVSILEALKNKKS
jgi:formate-dependent nitrite reductase membrane component NrfD